MPMALLSVTKKEPGVDETFMGIRAFARELIALGWEITGSKGTAGHLMMDGIRAGVMGVDIMDHAVATLGMQKSGGLLAKPTPKHLADLENIGGRWIDLVCCDLYDLASALANSELSDEAKNDKVDIGGPTMLSECAKGSFSGRLVICDPNDRAFAIQWIKDGMPDKENVLRRFAAKADAHVSAYRLLSAHWRSQGRINGIVLTQVGEDLKYGENPQQRPARLMTVQDVHPLAPSQFEQVAGTAPSYNNLQDLSAGIELMYRLAISLGVNGCHDQAIAIGLKHTNPCGVGVDADPTEAMRKMIEGDSRALFGGVVITNFPITPELARMLRRHQMPEPPQGEKPRRRPIDLVATPFFMEGAPERFKRPGDKCRLLVNSLLLHLTNERLVPHIETRPRYKQLFGGDWVQQPPNLYNFNLSDPDLRIISSHDPQMLDPQIARRVEIDLVIAAVVGSGAVSNTIAIVKDGQLLGLGCGQQDRVGAAELAVKRARDAKHDMHDAVAYSDSFFPFPDGALVLADAGIRAIYTSSGSENDPVVIDACKQRGVSLYMVPDVMGRGFKH